MVLRSGPSDATVLAGAPGAKVFVQFFEVTGEPRIHENGTPPGTRAAHGFSINHRCDDFVTGVDYQPLGGIDWRTAARPDGRWGWQTDLYEVVLCPARRPLVPSEPSLRIHGGFRRTGAGAQLHASQSQQCRFSPPSLADRCSGHLSRWLGIAPRGQWPASARSDPRTNAAHRPRPTPPTSSGNPPFHRATPASLSRPPATGIPMWTRIATWSSTWRPTTRRDQRKGASEPSEMTVRPPVQSNLPIQVHP